MNAIAKLSSPIGKVCEAWWHDIKPCSGSGTHLWPRKEHRRRGVSEVKKNFIDGKPHPPIRVQTLTVIAEVCTYAGNCLKGYKTKSLI